MPTPDTAYSLKTPMVWSYRPMVPVNCATHDVYFRGVKQTEPFFSWLGVFPQKKTAAPEETAVPLIHEGSSIP